MAFKLKSVLRKIKITSLIYCNLKKIFNVTINLRKIMCDKYRRELKPTFFKK